MSRRRAQRSNPFFAQPSSLVVGLVMAASPFGCGSDARGVGPCREIELARCEAAAQCGVIDADDVADCQLFHRDNCLHGMELEDIPGSVAVNECVEAIEQAGRCAKSKTSKTKASDCNKNLTLLADNDNRVCDIVREPERVESCEFLLGPIRKDDDEKDDDDPDAGKD